MPGGPLKLAIIGGGPSGFYVANRLLSLAPQLKELSIHVYDRLWAPHGLVRYGVAPDHPEVKNCTHKFDQVAADPRFKFFGNINFYNQEDSSHPFPNALQVPFTKLFPNYSHLLFASGCPHSILHPSLPRNLSTPALSLVHWYTSHPSSLSIPPPPLESTRHVTIIGHGNVSLDIARILLTPPEMLEKYDIPETVLKVLRKSQVERVSIVGRRGPLQSRFTNKEVREMMTIPGVVFVPPEGSSMLGLDTTTLNRQQSRFLSILKAGSTSTNGTRRAWELLFFRSPTSIEQLPPSSSNRKLRLFYNQTSLDPSTSLPIPSSTIGSIDTDLVITSLGQRSSPHSFPFENDDVGRVFQRNEENDENYLLKNVYVSGWAATGARGVLNSTLLNANKTAELILSDYYQQEPQPQFQQVKEVLNPSPSQEELQPKFVQRGIEEGKVTTYEDWKKIDEEERRRGQEEFGGKEKERMTCWEDVRTFLGR